MNIGIPTLAVFTIASILLQMQPAYAQEKQSPPPAPGQNRFKYAPNSFALDRPTGRGPSTERLGSVQQGSMPKSSSFLGITPQMPVAAPQPVFPPPAAMTGITPGWKIPNTFSNQFGAPRGTPPLTAVGQPIKVPSNKPTKMQPQIAMKPKKSVHASRNVVAVLKKKPAPVAMAATPDKAIESYGGEGYAPGAFMPLGSGSSSTTNVDGVLVEKRR